MKVAEITAFCRVLLLSSLSVVAMGDAATAAPLGYLGGTISENFDTLTTDLTNSSQIGLPKTAFYLNPAVNSLTGLVGWQGNNQGTSATSEYRSQNGSQSGNLGRGVVSFGSNGSTERALGALPTSNQKNQFGLVLQNDSALTFDRFDISFVGEQWRRGEVGVSNTMTFAYGIAANIDVGLTNVAALSFSNPNNQNAPTEVALDGNLAGNQVPVAGSVGGLSWGPGQTLVLRWAISEGPGQDNGMGIDNFEFTAHPVPEPTFSCAALLTSALLAGTYRRRTR